MRDRHNRVAERLRNTAIAARSSESYSQTMPSSHQSSSCQERLTTCVELMTRIRSSQLRSTKHRPAIISVRYLTGQWKGWPKFRFKLLILFRVVSYRAGWLSLLLTKSCPHSGSVTPISTAATAIFFAGFSFIDSQLSSHPFCTI